jgi:asparagine N-glycosylation enzyme membrane subunit Stt3
MLTGMGSPIMTDPYRALPLINLPWVAPLVSIGLAVVFLLVGMVWAIQSKELETAFAILVCVIIAVSPLSWDHYYIMIIIGLAVLWLNLAKHSFPPWRTLIFVIITLMLFLFNEHIGDFTLLLNGGKELVEDKRNPITFASSLLFWLPMVELIALTILLWRSGANQKQATIEDIVFCPHEV